MTCSKDKTIQSNLKIKYSHQEISTNQVRVTDEKGFDYSLIYL